MSKINENLNLIINSEEYKEIKKFYAEKSILDILDVSKKEFVHSNFLYWFFDPDEEHDLGTQPLKDLLEHYFLNNNYGDKDFDNIFNESSYEFSELKIQREHTIDKGRLDIYITGKVSNQKVKKEIVIIIENKIYSKENNQQTQNYYKWFEKLQSKDKIGIFIYLSPNGDEPSNNKFFPIDYQTMVEKVIEKSYDNTKNAYTKMIIQNYLKCLTFSKYKDYSVITNEEKDLFQKLLKKNEDKLFFIIEEGKNIKNEDLYKENKDVILNIFKLLKNHLKDNISKEMKIKLDEILGENKEYTFNGEKYISGKRGKGLRYFSLAMISIYAKKHSYESFLRNLDNVCKLYKNYPLIISKKELDKDKKNQREMIEWYFNKENQLIELNDNEKFYLYGYWDNDEIIELIKRIGKEVGYEEEQK